MAEEKKKGDAEKSIQAFNAWIDDVVNYGRKVNENFIAVDAGGSVVHSGYKLSEFKTKLDLFEKLDTIGLNSKDIEAVRAQVLILTRQDSKDPNVGYDTDVVGETLNKLSLLRKK
ncbi:MAG TPA: hypothetical protein DCX25_02710 [Candidatus Pacebacteria bacterium]|nr:MAG: hypothetical protein UX00_C0004G0034 [Microgenomates group bacterium GW2011_GWB1_45_17]KKU23968.1 MAG: hypothetical protein UX35_C0003G0104 [Microgenomates group bacterium GW2011_GWA1_46_15]KKU24639.1 MAG: hypothetical protein UX36_C0001G0256 [Microgenomates group bacterium GW2011_GWC1_46_15]HAV15216.1 hypothetical protein [Candidatus Paceibacterota bacterium]HCR10931.1 hypothetical protein [Candidatus Paceibacterota bacterium]